jgi:hypothetical protein
MSRNQDIRATLIPGKWYRIGEVGVDTARIHMVDPCYREGLRADRNCYDEYGERVSVDVSLGSDGLYSVFVQYDEFSCVTEIRILADGGVSRDNGQVPQ